MQKLRVMIVSIPGTWQRLLQRNIEAYPFVEGVYSVSGSLSASQMAGQHRPHLVLIDSSIPFDDAFILVQKLKKENPKIVLIVIADTVRLRRQMAESGADFTISAANYAAQFRDILYKQQRRLMAEGALVEAANRGTEPGDGQQAPEE